MMNGIGFQVVSAITKKAAYIKRMPTVAVILSHDTVHSRLRREKRVRCFCGIEKSKDHVQRRARHAILSIAIPKTGESTSEVNGRMEMRWFAVVSEYLYFSRSRFLTSVRQDMEGTDAQASFYR
jgi:hypothetical protein